MTATLLPPASLQFADANGIPYAGGTLWTYIPGTTTPKASWKDAAQAVLNTNPIVLDIAGRCIIYGSGAYRTILSTALGVLVFDQLTTSTTPVIISPAMTPVVTASTTDAGLIAAGIDSDIVPLLKSATVNVLLNTVVASGAISANPSIAFGPVGNAFATLGSIVQYGTTTSATLREFGASFGLESYAGYGGTGAFGIRADKVGVYSGIEGFANSADIWALNTVTRLAAGFPALSNSLGYELDFNNEAAARGVTDGLAGFAAPKAAGLLVTGASTFSSTAGIEVGGPSNTQWYRGIGVSSGVSQTAFYDYSTGTTGIEMQATHAGWGIDMLGSALGGAVRVPNNSGIYARNQANSADIAITAVDTSNNLLVGVAIGGGSTASGVYVGNNVVPFIDNSYSCGTSSNRFSTIYAATGAINTSDPSLKTDMAPMPSRALAVVNAIQPIIYRWIVGGVVLQDTTQTQTVQETATHEYDGFDIQVSDGIATKVPVTKSYTKDVYDTIPLLDVAGQPILAYVPAVPERVNPVTGATIPGRDAGYVPETHQVPRMVTKDVVVREHVDRPGKRIHGGFSAEDIGTVAGLLGLDDYAAFVRGPDGTLHYRPDEMSPILWQAVRELSTQVTALTAQVAALSAPPAH